MNTKSLYASLLILSLNSGISTAMEETLDTQPNEQDYGFQLTRKIQNEAFFVAANVKYNGPDLKGAEKFSRALTEFAKDYKPQIELSQTQLNELNLEELKNFVLFTLGKCPSCVTIHSNRFGEFANSDKTPGVGLLRGIKYKYESPLFALMFYFEADNNPVVISDTSKNAPLFIFSRNDVINPEPDQTVINKEEVIDATIKSRYQFTFTKDSPGTYVVNMSLKCFDENKEFLPDYVEQKASRFNVQIIRK